MKQYIKQHKTYLLASFFIPVAIMALVYLLNGIYPGSDRSILASDAFAQFSNFHASFRQVLLGKQSIFYTFNAALGLNYLSLAAYYLGGIFTPLVLFFPNQLMPDALYFLTLVKFGMMGLSFGVLAKSTYPKLPETLRLALVTCYSLLSFAVAQSELIMWLDAFIYLPLVILGIQRLIAKQKVGLLFISYFLLFCTSFYFGFMIGVFSVMFFFVQLVANFRKTKPTIIPFFMTGICSGCASMFILLPTLIDLKTNGESLTKISQWKTEDTATLDLLVKNFIGVYDTTKYGSIPFIFVGLLSLIGLTLYYLNKRFLLKEKIAYTVLIAILIASFYLEPLNLFWQGMHAPNMFLFRFAFLFSFIVVYLAGFGLSDIYHYSRITLSYTCLFWLFLFAIAYFGKAEKEYLFLTPSSAWITAIVLTIYMILFIYRNHFSKKIFSLVLLVIAFGEMSINSYYLILGIRNDWVYASRSLYTDPYPAISALVGYTKQHNQDFYRLENLDPVSVNDAFHYNYAGIGLFSSMRNRHASSYLNQLGFRSRGTNLNLRYPNNTLLMDSLFDIKYNLSTQPVEKYGFSQKQKVGDYQLYENYNALELGLLAPKDIYKVQQPQFDNLASQKNLFNALSRQNQEYFKFTTVSLVQQTNTKIDENGNITTYIQQNPDQEQKITYQVFIPANTQAYVSLFPFDFSQLDASSATVTTAHSSYESQIDINGQYYNLGYFNQDTTFQFTISLNGNQKLSFLTPKVLLLDTNAYQQAINVLRQNEVAFQVNKNQATATFEAKEDQVLFTTLAYDKGWQAKIDGKKVPIKAFKNALITIPVKKGKHTLTLTYYPPGLFLGTGISLTATVLFGLYCYYHRKKLLR